VCAVSAVLQCGYDTGEDRLYLRLPVEVCHIITPGGCRFLAARCLAFLPASWELPLPLPWQTPVILVSGLACHAHGCPPAPASLPARLQTRRWPAGCCREGSWRMQTRRWWLW
jgi:hypothetical protein